MVRPYAQPERDPRGRPAAGCQNPLRSWLLRGVQQATFKAQGHGTRLTHEFWTNGIIPAVMARFFALGSYKGGFRGELESFARIAEREAGSSF